jgi:hypothetical protein
VPPLTTHPAARARQLARLQRAGYRLEVNRRHHPAAEDFPAEFHGNFPEIAAVQPQPVPDQQLSDRLRAQQALRPHAKRGGEILAAARSPNDLIRVEDGTSIRVTFAPTATFPARSAVPVTSRGLIRPSVDRYAH